MEQCILALLLGWLFVCLCLTVTTSFTQHRRAQGATHTVPHALSGDTAPIVPQVARAHMGRRTA